MADASPYDELIMDHIKNARNYRVPDTVHREGAGMNPMCGDEMRVYLAMDGERISDVAFQCACCGISMASASIMTDMIKGKLAAEAEALVRDVLEMVTSRAESPSYPMTTERAALLDTVKRFPARTRCAALAWATVQGALSNERDVVTVP